MMNNILKFYGAKVEGFIIPLPGQKIEEVLKGVKLDIATLKIDDDSNFYEVFINFQEENIEKINSLSTDKILPEAIRAAKDHNEYVLELNQGEKEDNFFTDKLLLQRVIDRILYYGENFEKDLNSLFKKYDLKEEWITSNIDGSTVRKVEMPV